MSRSARNVTISLNQLMVTVPIADLRREPKHLTPQDFSHNPLRESQLVYGDILTLQEERNDWIYVSVNEQFKFTSERGWHPYPGWVHRSEVSLAKDPKKATIVHHSFSREKLIKDAESKFLGTPYLWGGKAMYSKKPIGGVDCSGLIYMLYHMQGKVIARDAHDQYLQSQVIAKDELKPGDLLFWAPVDRPRRMTHVVIYKNRNDFIEAPYSGENVRIQPLPSHFWEKRDSYRFVGRDLSYIVIPARL